LTRSGRVCDFIGWMKRRESGAFFNFAEADSVSVRKTGPCDATGFDLFYSPPIQDFWQFVHGTIGRHHIVDDRDMLEVDRPRDLKGIFQILASVVGGQIRVAGMSVADERNAEAAWESRIFWTAAWRFRSTG